MGEGKEGITTDGESHFQTANWLKVRHGMNQITYQWQRDRDRHFIRLQAHNATENLQRGLGVLLSGLKVRDLVDQTRHGSVVDHKYLG